MTLAPAPHLVVVEAPNGPAALALERRLAHLRPAAIARGGHWVVEIPAVANAAEVEAAVQVWLAEIGVARAVVRIDGRVSRVERVEPRPLHVPTHGNFIG